MKKLLLISISFFSFLTVISQGLLNEGANIVVEENAQIVIQGHEGNYTNKNPGSSNAEIKSDGIISVAGDWTNSSGDVFIDINNTGLVAFNENRMHIIGGTDPTRFENVQINSNDTLAIPSGKEIYVRNICTIEGNIIVNGVLNIENELIINGSIDGTGKICYCGALPQPVAGGSFDQIIEIKNLQGCTLSSDLIIEDSLVLTEGALILGNHDLSLKLNSGFSRIDNPANFIDATGNGYLIKELDQTGIYTFTLGNFGATSSYTPATVEFTSGIFISASLAVRLKNQKHPKNNDVTNYLNRYWELVESGISNFEYTATFSYDHVNDVVGNENQITGAINNPLEEFVWDETGQVDFTNHKFTMTSMDDFDAVTGIDICGPTAIIESEKVYCAGEMIEINALYDQVYCHVLCDLPVGYCESQSILNFDQYFSRIQLDDSSHTSNYSHYSDFTGSLFKALYLDSTYSLSLEVTNPVTQNHYTGIYIDWNRDGDFDDTYESHAVGNASGSTTYNYSLTVPGSASLGNTLIRFVVRHAENTSACGDYSIGETEDYLIELRDMDPSSIVSYNWAGPDSWTSSSMNNDIVDVEISNGGTYHLTVTDIYACTDEVLFDIIVADPQIFFPVDTIYTMQPETLFYDPGTFHSYLWNTGSTDQYLIVEDYGTYSLTVSDYHCIDSDSISILERQEIPLVAGWGIFSSYINTSIDFGDLLSDVINNIVIVKDYQGNVFTTMFGGYNAIGNHAVGESYLYYTTSQDVLIVYGHAVDPQVHPVLLMPGFYYLGYLRRSGAPVDELMSPINNMIEILKEEMGYVYWPDFNINQIGNMIPGKGYQIKMNNIANYYYPGNNVSFTKSFINNPQPTFYPAPVRSGSNMTIGIPQQAWMFDIGPNDEVGVYTSNRKLVGAGVYTGDHIAITAWGNDEFHIHKSSLNLNEDFHLEVWHHATGRSSELMVEEWLEGNGKYEENSIAIAGKITIIEENHALRINNYPNPFSNTTIISFNIPSDGLTEISIIDELGRTIEVITRKFYIAGKYEIEYNSGDLSYGNYFLQLKSRDKSIVKLIQKI